jgi:hypothetical protein
MMGGGMAVSTTPLEWRSRVRAIAQARPVVFRERDLGQSVLLLRKSLLGDFAVSRRQVKVKVERNRPDSG